MKNPKKVRWRNCILVYWYVSQFHQSKAFLRCKSHKASCNVKIRASNITSSNQTFNQLAKDLLPDNFASITASDDTFPMMRNVSSEDPCNCWQTISILIFLVVWTILLKLMSHTHYFNIFIVCEVWAQLVKTYILKQKVRGLIPTPTKKLENWTELLYFQFYFFVNKMQEWRLKYLTKMICLNQYSYSEAQIDYLQRTIKWPK